MFKKKIMFLPSTKRTFLSANSIGMGFSFCLTDLALYYKNELETKINE